MNRKFSILAVGALLLSAAACSDTSSLSDRAFASTDLAASFDFTPNGFSDTENSFAGADSTWGAHGEDHRGPGGDHGRGRGRGHGGPGIGLGHLMGGGLHDLFRGVGFGPGDGRGGHCKDETHGGLTISCTRTYNADSTALTTAITVKGTITRRDSSVTTVDNASTRTIGGLKSSSRTVDGAALGSETTVGKDTTGAFTVKRLVGDTIKAVVIPVPTDGLRKPYPTAGSIIRQHSITVTRASGTTSSTRREVIEYDGSSTAKVTITQDGTTKSCTVELPHGKLTCS